MEDPLPLLKNSLGIGLEGIEHSEAKILPRINATQIDKTISFVTENPTRIVITIRPKLYFFNLGAISNKDTLANIISINRLESIYYNLRKYI